MNWGRVSWARFLIPPRPLGLDPGFGTAFDRESRRRPGGPIDLDPAE